MTSNTIQLVVQSFASYLLAQAGCSNFDLSAFGL